VPTIEAQSRNKLKQGPRSTHPARFVPGIGRSPLSSQRVVTVGKLRSSPTHSCQKYENRMVSSLQYAFSLLVRCPGRVHTILHASITHTLYTEGSVDRGSVQTRGVNRYPKLWNSDSNRQPTSELGCTPADLSDRFRNNTNRFDFSRNKFTLLFSCSVENTFVYVVFI